ncbi:MAG: HK97 gp10 family phage protein [Thermomicrobium sp.]|nr:HK97 gp10 family phage protein [Thermomicrobium sp.]MDW8006649.1 HK97 gp10 family phage protein [Thermomicrobium sp.]
MIRIVLDDNGLIARWHSLDRSFAERYRGALAMMGAIAQREIARAAPAGATGILAHSITWEVRGSGWRSSAVVFSTDEPLKVLAVEYGRRPGKFPPWREGSALALWVKRMLGGDERVSFLVARAIARRGTKARRFFERGATQAEPKIVQVWSTLVAELEAVL